MPFDDPREFDYEHECGLSEAELATSESPVCEVGGHKADEVEMCGGGCEKYLCPEHGIGCDGPCNRRFCAACARKTLDHGMCDDCRDLPVCPSPYCRKPTTFTEHRDGDGLFARGWLTCDPLRSGDKLGRSRPAQPANGGSVSLTKAKVKRFQAKIKRLRIPVGFWQSFWEELERLMIGVAYQAFMNGYKAGQKEPKRARSKKAAA